MKMSKRNFKRVLALALTLLMSLSLVACGGGSDSAKDFPLIGTWKAADAEIYLRIQEDGKILSESVMTSTSTYTSNGVSSTTTSKSAMSQTFTWTVEKGTFLFNGIAPYKMTTEGDTYKLVGEKAVYVKVGDLNYDILNGETGSDTAAAQPTEAKDYAINTPIVAEGVEMTLTEKGLSDDIRISSRSSGIKITSGPSSEANKTFVYLKGTLKNTGKSGTFAAIGGKLIMDGYEYPVRTHICGEDATPTSMLDPLDNVIVLIYAHVPNELASSFQEAELIFGFNDNFETVDITNCDHLYSVDFTR